MKVTKESKNKGITLIALVITIIVMLILVGVTITMAVNGGLFDNAGKATQETNNAIQKEKDLANEIVCINNTKYNSIEEYINNITKKVIIRVESESFEFPVGLTFEEAITQGLVDTRFTVSNGDVCINGGILTHSDGGLGTVFVDEDDYPNENIFYTILY